MQSVQSEVLPQGEVLQGAVTSISGQHYAISMAKVYWDALSWLIENENAEGDVLSIIEELLPAAAREGFGASELVENVVVAMLDEIYEGQC